MHSVRALRATKGMRFSDKMGGGAHAIARACRRSGAICRAGGLPWRLLGTTFSRLFAASSPARAPPPFCPSEFGDDLPSVDSPLNDEALSTLPSPSIADRRPNAKKPVSELRVVPAHHANGSPIALFWGNAISRCKWAFEQDIFLRFPFWRKRCLLLAQ